MEWGEGGNYYLLYKDGYVYDKLLVKKRYTNQVPSVEVWMNYNMTIQSGVVGNKTLSHVCVAGTFIVSLLSIIIYHLGICGGQRTACKSHLSVLHMGPGARISGSQAWW